MTWIRSSGCVAGDCVEARRNGAVVVVRDSKRGTDWPLQVWTRDLWEGLLFAVGAGVPHAGVEATEDGVRLGLDVWRHAALMFTYEEWAAFAVGVKRGEFDFVNLPTPSPSVAGSAAGTSGSPDVSDEAGEGDTDRPSSAAPRPLAGIAPQDGSLPGGAVLADGPGLRPGPTAGVGEAAASSSRPSLPSPPKAGPPPVKPSLARSEARCDQDPARFPGESYLPGAAPSDRSSPAGRGDDRGDLGPAEAVTAIGQPGSDGARGAARAAVVARYEEEYAEPVVLHDFRRVLHSYADAAVDAFLQETWARAIEPLVPSESRPTPGVAGGDPAAVGGATVEPAAGLAAGGEVVPVSGQMVAAGTTEPEGEAER